MDGLRMDAINNLIYWQGNKDRELGPVFLPELRGTKELILHFGSEGFLSAYANVTKTVWEVDWDSIINGIWVG